MTIKRNRRRIINCRRRVFFAFLVLLVSSAIIKNAQSLSPQQLIDKQETYTVTLTYSSDARLPEDTSLSVREIAQNDKEYLDYKEQTAKYLEIKDDEIANAHFFDIKLLKDNTEIQPQAAIDVSIEFNGALTSDVKTVHFGDKIESVEPKLNNTKDSMQNSTISFEAKSFSVYGIVELPPANSDYAQGWHTVSDLETFDALVSKNIGFYIAQRLGYYFMDEPVDINNNGTRYGIKKTKPKTSYVDTAITRGAVPYYFEKVDGSHYRAYFFDTNQTKRYVKQSADSLLIVSNQSDATAFEIVPSTTHENNFIVVGSGDYCWNMQRGENGASFAAYPNRTDENAMLRFEYNINKTEEIIEINDKSFGIVRYDKNKTSNYYGAALTAATHGTNNNNLDTKQVEGKVEHLNFFEDYFVVQGSDMDLWKFEYVDGQPGGYYVSSMVGGTKKYLSYINNGSNSYSLVLVDEPNVNSLISVNLGSGNHAGMFNLQFIGTSLYVNLQNDVYSNGFRCSSGGPSESAWFYLANPIDGNDDMFDIFSARKVGVTEIRNGQNVVIYTRLWNNTDKKYDFYAIDHNGGLMRVYDNGDDISYVSINENTATWKFTEYYYDDSTPNYYYDFQNNYSGKYLAPQLENGQILADSPIGVIMNGRRYGDYYSQIIAWDYAYYDYAGFLVDRSDGLTPVRMSLSDDFYFAVVEEESASGLTVAETVDNSLFGVTMRMIDYNNTKIDNRDSLQMAVMGGAESNQPKQNLLYRNLAGNGYPVATLTDRSLSELFGNATVVNHLLTKNTYEESGYFEFDSTQSYAYLEDGTNFKVYNQIGTYQPLGNPSNSLKHGQFYPYNDLQEGFFATFTNTYDVHSSPLSDRNPRKGEKLYAVSAQDIDFHFGMEVEASFMQNESGKDLWGNDISFEFSGDDDMWLYVDGILVIDLGGVHSAQDASVNFATGEVKNIDTQTNLRELYRLAYLERYPSASDAEVTEWLDDIFKDGGTIFKDYTTHTMKMFYMERGGNASNLHMRFNLAPVAKGRIEMEKLLDGTDKQDYASSTFPFQIFYKNPGDSGFSQVQASDLMVFYKESGQQVTSSNLSGYGDVFWLKPGQHIYINFDSDDTEYYVRECGVNTQLYDQAIVNGTSLSGISVGNHLADYQSSQATVFDRRLVSFVNHVDSNALRTLTFTKRLYASDGTTELQSEDATNVSTYDDSLFNFRLYLGEGLDYYRLGQYHVKDPNGNYCVYDSTTHRFVSTGISDFDTFTDEQKILVTFTTSPSGAVSNIPAQYSIEIRDLLPETEFKVIERDYEIPEGYVRMNYERVNGSYVINDPNNPNAGVIKYEQSAVMNVKNKVSHTLKVQKIWTDDAFMKSHGDIYFAVFNGSNVTPIAVRRIATSERSIRFELDTISGDFSNYHIKEVALTNPVVDNDGIVTSYDTITILGSNNTLAVSGVYKGETASRAYDYSVSYNEGGVEGRWQNSKTSTVTNDRIDGINLYKTDKGGTPLENAVFKVTDNSGNTVGEESYTSDANGFIGKLYLKENTTYHIQELTPPAGYVILPSNIDIVTNATGSGIALSGGSAAMEIASVSTTTNTDDTLTIINTEFHLPETGGSGVTKINLLATLFIVLPLMYLGRYYMHERKRRRLMTYK